MTPTTDHSDSDWLTPGEVAATLRISVRTLHRMEQRRSLIPQRLPGGHRRYNRRDVAALLPREATK